MPTIGYSVTKRKPITTGYVCAHCGFASYCTVDAVGTGVGDYDILDIPIIEDMGKNAKQRADKSAEYEVKKNALTTLKLCPCPKCGKRDSTRFVLKIAFALIVAAVILVCVGAVVLLDPKGSAAIRWAIFGTCAVLSTAYIYRMTWDWRTAAKRIVFHDHRPPALAGLGSDKTARVSKKGKKGKKGLGQKPHG